MKNPDVSRICETFIQLPSEATWYGLCRHLIRVLRSKVQPLIAKLQKANLISWYCFAIHDRAHGVPAPENDNNPYVHLKLEPGGAISFQQVRDELPEYCRFTRRFDPGGGRIDGINNAILRNGNVQEAWRLIGDGSEWILKVLQAHSDDAEIPPEQLWQFVHLIDNATVMPKHH